MLCTDLPADPIPLDRRLSVRINRVRMLTYSHIHALTHT